MSGQGVIAGQNPHLPALAAWVAAHGLATLLVGGAFPPYLPLKKTSPLSLAEQVAQTLVEGLRVRER